MKQFRYPVSDPREWDAMRRMSPLRRLALRLRDARYRRRAASVEGVALSPLGAPPRPLSGADLPLVCVVRNAGRYVASFLAHYRRLGVTRFAIVDDGSDDGTREFLLAQADVDLFGSNVSYARSCMGRIWHDMLFDLLGRDRWYVNVDADEFLLFPDCETRGLRAFIADLEAHGAKRALAPMLDLYPPGRLADGVFDPARHEKPSDVSSLIDGGGYAARVEKISLSIRGGPRTRLFGSEIRMTKFPVVFVDARTQENGASIHGPLPLERNFTAPSAVLLHYKFSSESVREFQRYVEEGEHFGGAVFYREITQNSAFTPDLSLAYEGSIPVGPSMEFVRRGFMEDLRARAI
ncbi:glycosyltransferase family 2 protein [Aureimonas populi]|uniref:Glycosyltransferase family 2 protein n=1 Tax=Aureimonas populi TaxID=1701758 RepID=A0ABW5CNA6_9HYPH|nr:glycosyltransferase family 2 protein [Aureimonas populi]